MRNLLKWSLLLTFLMLLPLRALAGEEAQVQSRITQYMKAWEKKDITAMEFMLYNSFVAADGSNKQKFIARLKKEAPNVRSRNIQFHFTKITVSGNNATVVLDMQFLENFVNSDTGRMTCRPVTLNLVRWSDGKWYLSKESYQPVYNCLE